MTWIIVPFICIPIQILEHIHNMDSFNYFCFPFTTSSPSDPFILSLHIAILLFDSLLVVVCILCNAYVLVFSIKQKKQTNKTLKAISKWQDRLQKFAIRMAVLILSTVFTWLPILCIQFLVLLEIAILPNIYMWCVLISFPVNLIIDPVLLIRNLLVWRIPRVLVCENTFKYMSTNGTQVSEITFSSLMLFCFTQLIFTSHRGDFDGSIKLLMIALC